MGTSVDLQKDQIMDTINNSDHIKRKDDRKHEGKKTHHGNISSFRISTSQNNERDENDNVDTDAKKANAFSPTSSITSGDLTTLDSKPIHKSNEKDAIDRKGKSHHSAEEEDAIPNILRDLIRIQREHCDMRETMTNALEQTVTWSKEDSQIRKAIKRKNDILNQLKQLVEGLEEATEKEGRVLHLRETEYEDCRRDYVHMQERLKRQLSITPLIAEEVTFQRKAKPTLMTTHPHIPSTKSNGESSSSPCDYSYSSSSTTKSHQNSKKPIKNPRSSPSKRKFKASNITKGEKIKNSSRHNQTSNVLLAITDPNKSSSSSAQIVSRSSTSNRLKQGALISKNTFSAPNETHNSLSTAILRPKQGKRPDDPALIEALENSQGKYKIPSCVRPHPTTCEMPKDSISTKCMFRQYIHDTELDPRGQVILELPPNIPHTLRTLYFPAEQADLLVLLLETLTAQLNEQEKMAAQKASLLTELRHTRTLEHRKKVLITRDIVRSLGKRLRVAQSIAIGRASELQNLSKNVSRIRQKYEASREDRLKELLMQNSIRDNALSARKKHKEALKISQSAYKQAINAEGESRDDRIQLMTERYADLQKSYRNRIRSLETKLKNEIAGWKKVENDKEFMLRLSKRINTLHAKSNELTVLAQTGNPMLRFMDLNSTTLMIGEATRIGTTLSDPHLIAKLAASMENGLILQGSDKKGKARSSQNKYLNRVTGSGAPQHQLLEHVKAYATNPRINTTKYKTSTPYVKTLTGAGNLKNYNKSKLNGKGRKKKTQFTTESTTRIKQKRTGVYRD